MGGGGYRRTRSFSWLIYILPNSLQLTEPQVLRMVRSWERSPSCVPGTPIQRGSRSTWIPNPITCHAVAACSGSTAALDDNGGSGKQPTETGVDP